MSEETISEEQVLHNELSFEINQELIHLMKRIIEIQRANKQLKEVIDEVRERVEQVAAYPYANFDIETKEGEYQVSITEWFDDLLQILDKAGDIDEKKN